MNKKILSKRVLFCGYYGMDNVGDDCFGAVSTWGAKRYWNTKKIFLLSSKDVDGPIMTSSCLSDKQSFRGQIKFQSYLEIVRSSCFIMSGGSIFCFKLSVHDPRRISLLASKFGIKPVGAIGVSIGPYESINDQKSVHKYLRELQFLALRDKASYDEPCSLNLPFKPIMAADLAMLLPEMVPESQYIHSENKVLGIIVCHYERYVNGNTKNEKRREDIILCGLLKLIEEGYDGVFRLFVFNSNAYNGDQGITLEFLSKLRNNGAKVELVHYSLTPVAIWKKVAECTAIISIRLHGAIFAAAGNIPCCLIEYHKKCSNFLSDIGVSEKWIIGDACCSSNDLAGKLSDLLKNQQVNYYPKRQQLIEMAKLNFTFDK
ncbi:MAG: polysaccharide pyruvyl transferase family protein [Chlorobiaceae bacterium]